MSNTDKIQVPISAAPFTEKPRAAQHLLFGITASLEMMQQVRVFYTNEQGVLIHQIVDQDESLSPEQKELAKAQYPVRDVSKTTEGAYCDPATGAIVEPGTPGGIPQRDFFQAITIERMMQITGTKKTDSFAEVIYRMIAGEIQKIDARGHL